MFQSLYILIKTLDKYSYNHIIQFVNYASKIEIIKAEKVNYPM